MILEFYAAAFIVAEIAGSTRHSRCTGGDESESEVMRHNNEWFGMGKNYNFYDYDGAIKCKL